MWALAPSLLAGGEPIRPDYPALVMASQPQHYWRLNDGSFTAAINSVAGGTNGSYSAAPNTRSYPIGGPVVGGGYMVADAAVNTTGMNTGVTTNYTSAFTVECFFYAEASQPDAGPHIWSKREYFASAFSMFPTALLWDPGNTRLQLVLDSGNDFNTDATLNSSTLATGRWYHCACVYRASGLCEIYVDGEQVAQTTIGFTITSPATAWRIGHSQEYGGGVGTSSFNGRVAEFAIYNRALPAAEIRSHLAGRMTKDGYRKKTVSQLYSEWGDPATEIVDLYGKRWPVAGNTTVNNTRSRFGRGSIYLDGTGDYLQPTPHPDFTFGTGDFTIEGWFYSTSTAAYQILFDFRPSETNGAYPVVGVTNTGAAEYWVNSGSRILSPSTTVRANTWHHIAAQRKSGTTYLLVDGMLCGSWADTTDYLPNHDYGLRVGTSSFGATPYSFVGSMDSIQITKGAARYPIPGVPAQYSYDLSAYSFLAFDGADQSTTFTDSAGNLTWTRQGGAVIATAQSKYGGASGYFDGSGDYLSGSGIALEADGSDFTLEAWIYPTATDGTNGSAIFSQGSSGAAGRMQMLYSTTQKLSWQIGGTDSGSGATTIPLNQWTHVAMCRRNGYVYLFVNGVLDGVASGSTSVQSTTPWIGNNWAGNAEFQGYIDHFRVTRRFARYVGQSGMWSRRPHYDPYFDNVVALIPGDLLGASTNIYDVTGKTWTAYGNAQGSASAGRFGGYSLVFDGNGDYLSSADSSDWDFGTGDFTVEGWFYWSVLPSNNAHTLIGNYDNANANDKKGWSLQYRTDGSNRVRFGYGDTALLDATTTLSTSTWYHLAASRRSGTLYILLNGNVIGSVANSTDITGAVKTMQIGALHDQQGSGWIQYFNGYMDSIRITKGVARYPEIQTLPQGLYSTRGAGDVTVLDLQGSNNATSTTDLAGVTWTFNGNAKISTDQFKFGTSSLYLDGTGDYLSASTAANFGFGTGDFTVEGWVKTNKKDTVFFDNRTTAHAGVFGATSVTTGYMNYYDPTTGAKYGVTNLSDDAWHHVAWVRRNGVMYMYADGKLEAAFANTQDFGATRPARIGVPYSGSADLLGYVAGVRISKFARYYPGIFAPFPFLKGP